MPNPYETWRKYSPHEVIIFPKFHKNWEKIVDFLPEHLDFTFSRLGWTGLYKNFTKIVKVKLLKQETNKAKRIQNIIKGGAR